MPSPWVRWSCPKCGVGVSLRANSKAVPMHHCYRQRDKWCSLTKETNDQTNPGGRDPARPRGGTGARTSNQDQPSGGYSHLPASDKHDVTTFNDIAIAGRRGLVAYHDKPAVYLPTGGVVINRWLIFPGAPEYRDALARAGGFGTYAGFLAFCEWVCGA